ncbi:hypothetical protein JAK47_01890 [Stenotrophomonas maltophilia]|uniref:hypothetical protein n=1 Tax=Stenotrophomonas maltophilia TaxID=40324 RepID=UPI0021CA97DB|nr:hypothetical protein [Stenotrophomonas maltophilia]MCU1053297.1 hypothetical protein [Stenotrophomonas maltophilia]
MSTDKTLTDVQPGGRVRLGDQAERARFEEWPQAREFEIQKDGSGEYLSEVTHGAWLAWKYLSAQPSPGGQGDAVLRAINSKDLYQVLMDVQNGIDSPALASMANGAIQLIDKARSAPAALAAHAAYHTGKAIGRREAELEAAARQPVALIAQEVGDYRVTVAEDAITVSRGRDIVFAYSAGDPEPINARQPGDFDDKELQFYREHIGNDLDNMLMGAGVFEVTHEGGYEACWANSMDALKRLIDRKPVEFERAIPTRRRESAVELLLSLGFVWNNQRWEDRRQPVGESVSEAIEQLADDVESCVSDACGYLASDSGWDDYGIYRDDAAERYRALPDRIRALTAPPAQAVDLGQLPDGWRLSKKATCYQLSHGNDIIGNLVGPDAEENAAIIARVLDSQAVGK